MQRGPEESDLPRNRKARALFVARPARRHAAGPGKHRYVRHFARNSRSGLTLIELSIVIMVIGILLGLIFGTIAGITQVMGEVGPASRQKYQTLQALAVMRASLNQTLHSANLSRLVFVGTSQGNGDQKRDVLTFAAVNSGAEEVGLPAVREISYYLRDADGHFPCPGQGGGCVLMRREDQTVDDEPGEGGAHYVLLEDVESLEFQYTLNGIDWRPDWNNADNNRIPRIVRIRMRVKIGERVQQFDTMARPGLYIR